MSAVEKVADLVESLRRERQLDTRGEALAAVAERLAEQVDSTGEDSSKLLAGAARELRATIDALTSGGIRDGDDDWTAGLSAQVRDTAES